MSLGYVETLIQADVDGSALTAAARASALPPAALFTFPANYFRQVGQQLTIDAWGRISCVVTTPGTARFDAAFGGTAIMDSLAIPLNIVAKTNVSWHLHIEATLRAKGTSANFMWQGYWASEAVVGSPLPSAGGSGVILLPYNTAPVVSANFDSKASQQLDLNFTQTVATGSMTLHQYRVTSLN